MNTKMISENRTLENSFVNGFDPVNHDKWVEELVGEVNWPENSSSEDVDVVRNFDDEPSYDFKKATIVTKYNSQECRVRELEG